MGVSDEVLIDVFEMLIKRIDTMNDTIEKMNDYLVSEARFKTNNIISGKIFNYPFEIQNYNFSKKRHAFISIKLKDKLHHKSLYDITWSLLMNEELSEYTDTKNMELIKESIINTLGEEALIKMQEGIKIYLNEDKEEYLTCKKYNIDTIYEYLPEYLINNFIILRNENSYIKSFNHVSYNINISTETVENLYIDDVIELILNSLQPYSYNANDIQEVKIVGMNSITHEFIKNYYMNELNLDLIKEKMKDYINKKCYCIKEQIKVHIIEYIKSGCQIIPILSNIDMIKFILALLEDTEDTIEYHS